ncbi:unknown protein [Seminavis robusta]|uniref:Uncharacterized protein n=1 Tax=Seminavis robusta TaxID=568900 RepID=A0A9N8F2K8_9STRA|nr:unknown protein [Seminavis robusta]|eukprot:Sro3063_g343010.1 n/a (526) ;mRNA; r:1403-3095
MHTTFFLTDNNNKKDMEMNQKADDSSTNEEDESLLHIVNRLSHGTYSDAELAKLSGLRSAHVSQTETTSSLLEASQNLSGSVPSPSSDPYVHSDGQNQVNKTSSISAESIRVDVEARMMLKDQLIVGEAAMYQKDRLVCAGSVKTQNKDQAVLDKAGINQGMNQGDPHNLGGNRPNGLWSAAQNQEETGLMIPGAYAVAPEGLHIFAMTPTGTGVDVARDVPIPPEPAPDTLEDGLPVANEVSENLDLPVADLDPTGQDSSRRAERKKQSIMLPALLYGSCVAAFVIVVALLVNAGRNNGDTYSGVSDPTYSPLPPENAKNLSDVELLVVDALSNHTLEALEDPNSPQSHAYEWMLEDLDENNYTHTSRIRQRYALATLFYATGGHDWYNNENWLNQSVHECFWFSQECTRKEDCTPCGIPPNLLNSSNQAVHMEYNPYQHLLLYSNALQGTLPLELFWLANLKTIDLFQNTDLAGTISSLVGRLSQSEHFGMEVTMISGTIPTELGLFSEPYQRNWAMPPVWIP